MNPPKARQSKWSNEWYTNEDILCYECLKKRGIVYVIYVESRKENFYACAKCFDKCMKKIFYICNDAVFETGIYRNIKRYPLDAIERVMD